MNYSAGMVSQVFAFVETKQTAELMAAGMSKDEVQDKVIGENLYQLEMRTDYGEHSIMFIIGFRHCLMEQ